MKFARIFRGLSVVLAFLLLTAIALTVAMIENAGHINRFFNIDPVKLIPAEGEEAPQYFKSDYCADVNNPTQDELAKKDEAAAAFVEREQEEGSVLLKNDLVDGEPALPLTGDEKQSVSLFGRSSVNPYRKANSGGGNGGESVDYLQALEERGFAPNQTLLDAYRNDTSPGRSAADYRVGESALSVYTPDVRASFAATDVAIVMLSRDGGENHDLVTAQADDDGSGSISQLALHKNERDMLELVKEYKDNGTFKKVIVLLNTSNTMEAGWLDEYGVDACLYIGGPGNSCGFRGVADILIGDAVPSGRLVDTYATNSLSAPATANFGDFSYSNTAAVASQFTDDLSTSQYYVALAEGIYVGYRYYETRYEDCVLGRFGASSDVGTWASQGEWSYADEVTFPFGYGLSYTTFEQALDGVTDNGDGTMTATVTVRNTGGVAGKSVVQLYAQTPYGDYEIENLVEKSAIQLVAFEKTDEIAPGESAQVELTVDKYMLAAYDYIGAQTYILSEGAYYLALGDDAHDALNNVLMAKKAGGAAVDEEKMVGTGDAEKVFSWEEEFDSETYARTASGEVTNRLQKADANYWEEGAVTYLTRSDWEGTYPEAVSLTANADMIAAINSGWYTKPADAPGYRDVVTEADNGLTFADMWEVEFESELWDKLVDQMSVEELCAFPIDQNALGTVESINFPGANNCDGIDGVMGCTCYVNQSVAAASWNKELLAERGDFMAEDALFAGKHHLWGPGLNLHRTPFGGRNFEYYSEDPVLSYELAASQIGAMSAKGLLTGPKHLFANDQEMHRNGLGTYGNEQALRELYLRPFEGAFLKGNARATMTAFNRIGPVYVGEYSDVLDGILRGEWGFHGIVITDAAGENKFMHNAETMVGGTNVFCYTNESRAKDLERIIKSTDDGYLLQVLKENAKEVLYAYSTSSRMNGLTPNTLFVEIIPWWQYTVIGIDIALGVFTLGALAAYVVGAYVLPRRGKKEAL